MLVDQDGYRSLGVPVKLSDTPGHPGHRPARLSEHAEAILGELGYDRAAIEALRAEGVVTTPRL